MRKFHILFVSSFLLNSCSNTPSQDADIAAIRESLLNQKEMSKVKETNDSHLSITLSEKLDKISWDVTTSFALSVAEQVETNSLVGDNLSIPNEIILQIFSELSVAEIAQASQVCHRWYEITKNPALWRTVRLRIHGDYPANEATKEQAKLHLLRVRVNTLSELAEIKRLITKYDLNKGRPFVRYQTLAYEFIDKLSPDLIEEQIAQGSELGIERKIEGLAYDEYGYGEYEYDDYDQNLEAIACNEQWVERGNEKAIGRKIDGINCGRYGYEEDVKAAFDLNEWFVNQGYEAAIERKVRGLVVGQYGYKKDSRAAFELNEHFAEQGNQKAINRKIKGLTYEVYGYPEDSKAAFDLNEYSIVQGNPKAITRKVKGLAYGRYGYEKNLDAALAFNQWLIEEGNEGAIIRKVKSLAKEKSPYSWDLPLYQKDLTQLKNWLEEEATKGTRWACYLKAQGLKHGILGFGEDREAAVSYIKEHYIPY